MINQIIINGRVQPLTAERYLIGRGDGCDILLPETDMAVSRRHAMIERNAQGEWNLLDISSRNGTLVNNQQVAARYTLQDGDVLRIGTSEIKMVLPRSMPTIFLPLSSLPEVSLTPASQVNGLRGPDTQPVSGLSLVSPMTTPFPPAYSDTATPPFANSSFGNPPAGSSDYAYGASPSASPFASSQSMPELPMSHEVRQPLLSEQAVPPAQSVALAPTYYPPPAQAEAPYQANMSPVAPQYVNPSQYAAPPQYSAAPQYAVEPQQANQPQYTAAPQYASPIEQTNLPQYANPPQGNNVPQVYIDVNAPQVHIAVNASQLYVDTNAQMAGLGLRFCAYLIDGLVAIPLHILASIPFAGLLFAPLVSLYWLSRDAFFGGQSVGKKAMGIRVIRNDGQPFTWGTSVLRNFTAFILFFQLIPLFGFLAVLIMIPVSLLDILIILCTQRRIGDSLANTRVVVSS